MKKKLFFLPMVAIIMAACSSNETIEVNENKGDLISFHPIVKGVTRAADADLTSDATSFNVVAFNTGTTTSPFFSNLTFTNTSRTFTSATKYYWPTNNLDFYAYSPITTNVEDVQKGALSNGNYQIVKTDYKTFTITPSNTVSEQVDFIYANTNNKGKGSTGEVTTLNFRQAGAKIAVKVKNSAPNLKFEISGWKLGYLDNSATFTYGDATTDTKDGAQLAFSDWSENTTQSAANTYSTEFTANAIAASQSTAYFLGNAGTPSTSATDESLNMILIPQTLTAATAYASTTAGAKPNGSYIALKMVIKNNTDAGETVADATADGKWAIWPIGGYNWEPGKKYTYTIDLAGGGYYETNQDTDADLDPILEGAEIKFATVTVDGWTDRAYDVPTPTNLAELKAFIANGGDYNDYIGYYVDNTGKISASSTGAIGAIAHIGTSNVDTSFDGSRIIILSRTSISNIRWDNSVSPTLTGIDGVNDNTTLNGYANTQALYTADNTKYLAAKAAWEYQSKNGAPVVTGSSGWFLPSYQQAKLIVSNASKITTVLDSYHCWSSTEFGDDNGNSFNDYSYAWTGSKKGDRNVRPCFVY